MRKARSKKKLSMGLNKRGRESLYYPSSITFDRQRQHIIVADDSHNCIEFFERKSLEQVTPYGSTGQLMNRFSSLRGLCFQPFTRHLLLGDSGNNCVRALARSGDSDNDVYEVCHSFGQGCGDPFSPNGVCCTSDGSIAVTDNRSHQIKRFDAAGRFVGAISGPGDDSECLEHPGDICCLDQRFAPSSSASSLLLVCDSNHCRVSAWSARDNQFVFCALGLSLPFRTTNGVCVDLNGFVYITSGTGSTSMMQVYDVRGGESNFVLCQSFRGRGGDTLGEFNEPSGLCVDDTNVLMITDTLNHRVQFFE